MTSGVGGRESEATIRVGRAKPIVVDAVTFDIEGQHVAVTCEVTQSPAGLTRLLKKANHPASTVPIVVTIPRTDDRFGVVYRHTACTVRVTRVAMGGDFKTELQFVAEKRRSRTPYGRITVTGNHW